MILERRTGATSLYLSCLLLALVQSTFLIWHVRDDLNTDKRAFLHVVEWVVYFQSVRHGLRQHGFPPSRWRSLVLLRLGARRTRTCLVRDGARESKPEPDRDRRRSTRRTANRPTRHGRPRGRLLVPVVQRRERQVVRFRVVRCRIRRRRCQVVVHVPAQSNLFRGEWGRGVGFASRASLLSRCCGGRRG